MLKTLKQQGGLTLDRDLNMVNFSQGYQVSFEDVDIIDINIVDNDGLIERLQDLKQAMNENDYIGLWVDNQKLYIDYSCNIDDIKDAIAVGEAYNQIAVFDWSSKDSIYL